VKDPCASVDPDDFFGIAEKYGGYWGEHPIYTLPDWRTEVQQRNTRQGYWSWVNSRLEEENCNLNPE